jgi:PAS domain S-box-containing protein
MAASPQDGHDKGSRARELEAALEAVSDYAIITLDADGMVRDWNRGAEAMRGFTSEEIIGQPVSIFYTPEDRQAGLAERELREASADGRFHGEGWRVRKDGSRFWATVTVVPVRDGAGAVTGFVKATRDTTEQKRAESLFAGLLESAPDAMVITSGDGRIEVVNRQAEVLFGYSRAELAGREVEMLIPGRFRERHPGYRAGYAAEPRTRPMGAGLELWGLRKDGSEFPVEISLAPLETPDQGLLVAAAIRDVTERRETELRLQHQRDEIMELSTPVIQVWDKVLALPIIGTLDSLRAARLTEGLLTQIGEHQAEVVILDISGVPAIDTQVAQHLLRTVQAATLMGATSILCGVRPETAQAMVHLGIDLGRLRSRTTLRDALQLAMKMLRERAAASASAEAAAAAREQPA